MTKNKPRLLRPVLRNWLIVPRGVYFIVFIYNDGHRLKQTKNIYVKR